MPEQSSEKEEKSRSKLRPKKSFSETLDSIGTSFHNIFERHQKNNKKSKSLADLHEIGDESDKKKANGKLSSKKERKVSVETTHLKRIEEDRDKFEPDKYRLDFEDKKLTLITQESDDKKSTKSKLSLTRSKSNQSNSNNADNGTSSPQSPSSINSSGGLFIESTKEIKSSPNFSQGRPTSISTISKASSPSLSPSLSRSSSSDKDAHHLNFVSNLQNSAQVHSELILKSAQKEAALSGSNSLNSTQAHHDHHESHANEHKIDSRRRSMHWVDFLTETGLPIEQGERSDQESNGDSFIDEDELRDSCPGSILPPNEFMKRKIWFHQTLEDQDEKEEEVVESGRHLTGDFESPQNNFFRKIRKDSIALSIKSNRSARSPFPNNDGQHRNVDDLIFDMFREKDEEVAVVGTFLSALEKTGLRKDDPRLAELFENLRRVHKEQEASFPGRIGSIETLRLDRETFKVVITDNIVLISKAFRQQFVIPEFQTFCGHIEEMYWKCRDVKGGKVAEYIPQLARVDPTLWGVSICTIDGQRYSIGDTMIPFTIQSCSKPLTYAIALNELGEDTVHQYVGQEPSGRMFNELVLDYNKKPHNPMVNAGAIIICSLLKSMVRPEMSLAEKFDYTHNYFRKLCGGEYVGFNNAVFLSEREVADRNYALGFYMRENKCFPEGTNLKECMDYYFQICSMECNCEAMSVMAATLANGGICPVSGEKVLKSESVRDVLSLMHSCGMYDYSGQFAFKVGLPAKSGVSGAIMLVVPNVLGMAVWSPPLDVLGNAVRGVALCQELVSVFNFHKYDNLKHASDKLDPRRHRYETKGLNIVNLLFSAASGDVTSMRRHHLSGMDMNASDYDGRTALHLAAAEGHLECVEYLLRHCHVTPKPVDRWGHLPVDDAEKFGHEDVTAFLKKWAEENPE